ncbi:F0F1 ATP synthase subunit delta [Candidatus Daviesbacteria bacterium]|nr:F0F1 ATP synthase subunit delta [Candidatus Daviesbacteria bacterium]
MNQLWDQIITNTYTLKSLKNRLRILRDYLTKQQFTNGVQDQDEKLTDEAQWINSLGKDFLAKFNQHNIYSLLDEMESETSKQEPLTIFLAFELPNEEISKLGSWIRVNFGQKYLMLDIKYDPSLIGGCALTWKGIYHDYSVKKKIEDNKQQVLESFKTYLR